MVRRSERGKVARWWGPKEVRITIGGHARLDAALHGGILKLQPFVELHVAALTDVVAAQTKSGTRRTSEALGRSRELVYIRLALRLYADLLDVLN